MIFGFTFIEISVDQSKNDRTNMSYINDERDRKPKEKKRKEQVVL